ncbi:MAG: SDR family oxidoreductase [Anaerolineae bacterium]|nr:SDR family oxidoreductase [Anaerolineae bacterium]
MKKPLVHTLLDFKEKVVLVTGAGGGVGAGIATRFAEAGADVAIHYRANAEGARTTAARIKAMGSSTLMVQAELTRPGDAEQLVSRVIEKFGHLDVLINNAGVYPVTPLLNIRLEEWQEVINTNLTSAFLCLQAAASQMTAQGSGGSIINIISIEALNPAPGHSHYAASKAGMDMLGRTAARELGKFGIRVNSVAPGLIERDGIEQAWPDGVSRWLSSVPLQRMGTPEDIGDACLFLASPAARWISGATLVVDGGMLTNQVF